MVTSLPEKIPHWLLSLPRSPTRVSQDHLLNKLTAQILVQNLLLGNPAYFKFVSYFSKCSVLALSIL